MVDDTEQNGIRPPGHAWDLYGRRRRWLFLVLLFLVASSCNFDYYVISVVLEPIKDEFHVSDTDLGLLSGFASALFYALAALPFARWSERGNRRDILTLALAGWSAMTILCGYAQSFWWLVLARVGVGAMEPGATPPAQSLIADYFPAQERGKALAVFLGGATVGNLLGIALGGVATASYGWRSPFRVAGALGLGLALLTHWLLAEPREKLRRTTGRYIAESERESWSRAVGRLRSKQSFIWISLGLSIFYFFYVGVVTFLPSLMIRTMRASLSEVGVSWGIAYMSAEILGTLIGGVVADHLSKRDIRWYCWLSAIACLLGMPLVLLALSCTQLWKFVGLDFLAELVLAVGTTAAWPAIHAVCGNPRRATAVAVVQFAYILIGAGFGPLVAGGLSDALAARYGADSLRSSLGVMTLALALAAVAFWISAKTIRQDQEA